MKNTLVILFIWISSSVFAQKTNSFVLIYSKGKSYSPTLLPIESYKSFISDIIIEEYNASNSNGRISIYENGNLVKSYSKINLDSINWKGKNIEFIPVYTNNYNWINLPLNIAQAFSDSLRLESKYFYTDFNMNSPTPYDLTIQGSYQNLPDTVGMSFSKKTELSNEYKNNLISEITSTFPELEAEISVFSTLPFQPRITFYLKNNYFLLLL